MRLYLLIGDIQEENTFGDFETKTKGLGFVRSEKQAKFAVGHIAEYTEGIESIHYKKEDVPNDKEGFIKWLNEYCWQGEGVQELINEVIEEV